MNETCNPLFVIGSGRSGTHLIAKIIDSSNEIVSNIEQNPIFKRAKKSVFLKGSFVGNINYQILKIHYKKRLRKSSSKYFLDKSHPNLFLTEKLNLDFQGAKFIAVKRNVYSTIASMLRHKGVSRHFINSKKFTHPNEFLGTNLIEHRDYLDLQNVEKACYRWVSHQKKINSLNKLQNVHIVDYDELIENPRTEINKIEEFLGLKLSFKEKIIDTSQKFTQVLSKEDITRINSILLNHFEEEYLKKTVI